MLAELRLSIKFNQTSFQLTDLDQKSKHRDENLTSYNEADDKDRDSSGKETESVSFSFGSERKTCS